MGGGCFPVLGHLTRLLAPEQGISPSHVLDISYHPTEESIARPTFSGAFGSEVLILALKNEDHTGKIMRCLQILHHKIPTDTSFCVEFDSCSEADLYTLKPGESEKWTRLLSVG